MKQLWHIILLFILSYGWDVSSFTTSNSIKRGDGLILQPLCSPVLLAKRKLMFQASALEKPIEYQSDSSTYGRGDMHLSAVLDEGDVVVYKTGTWEVDGVEVGNGNPTAYEFCLVETMQIVWTHNCEHGYIRGMEVKIGSDNNKLEVVSPLNFVDFGPEQLVARLPLNWINDSEAELLATLPEIMTNS